MRLCGKMVEPSSPHVTICRMRNECWINMATDTHSECVIVIAFTRQPWLRERASIVRYVDIASLVPHRIFKWRLLLS